ncbi:nonsense-mediated mRNA decay factor SMG9-like, partial [Mustelus asterias]
MLKVNTALRCSVFLRESVCLENWMLTCFSHDGIEEPVRTKMQKTPIILAKPPAERGNKAAPTPPPPAGNPADKPIVLMKARDEGKASATGDGGSQAPAASGKAEKEFQRPTQPVYQIQNRGMAPSAPSSNVD